MNRALRLKPQRVPDLFIADCFTLGLVASQLAHRLPGGIVYDLEALLPPPVPARDKADPTAYVADMVINLGPVPARWQHIEGGHRGSIKGL